MFLLRSAFMKQWKYTGYIDLEPQEWKKLSWLSVSSVLKLMWHLLNKNSILLVSFQLSTSDEASAGSDLRDTLRFGNQTHQFFFFFFTICRYTSIHNLLEKKQDIWWKKNPTWPSSSSYIESHLGEALLQRVTFECLGGGMCWCVSLLLRASAASLMIKSHSGMGHFVIKCSVVAQVVTLLSNYMGMGLHGDTYNLSLSDSLGYLILFMQTSGIVMEMFGRLL